MFPVVSSLEPPTGHRLASSFWDLRCNQSSTKLLAGSKTESIAVARKDKDPDVIAAYTVDVGEGTARRKDEKTHTAIPKGRCWTLNLRILLYGPEAVSTHVFVKGRRAYRQAVRSLCLTSLLRVSLHRHEHGVDELYVASARSLSLAAPTHLILALLVLSYPATLARALAQL